MPDLRSCAPADRDIDEELSTQGRFWQAAWPWQEWRTGSQRSGWSAASASQGGKTRSNDTHASTADNDARLYRKGKGQSSQLWSNASRVRLGHALMENRNGLTVGDALTRSSGAAALAMASDLPAKSKTVGGDKGYDTKDFVMELCQLGITPHGAQNAYDTVKAKRRTAIDGRTTRHPGYGVSQKKRNRIEEIFGWLKTIAGLRQSKFRGLDRVGMSFTFALTAYNLIRMPKLLAEAGT